MTTLICLKFPFRPRMLVLHSKPPEHGVLCRRFWEPAEPCSSSRCYNCTLVVYFSHARSQPAVSPGAVSVGGAAHYSPASNLSTAADWQACYLRRRAARAFYCARIIKEIIRAVPDRGAHPDCPFGPAGLGDVTTLVGRHG